MQLFEYAKKLKKIVYEEYVFSKYEEKGLGDHK